MFQIGIIDHLEGQREDSKAIFDETVELIRIADELGVGFGWFAEHHFHVHRGHMPAPLLFAMHLAGKTSRIQLGTAIICTDLHHPIDMAEQVALADVLAGGRLAIGFGSGCTPEEAAWFGIASDEGLRHARFERSLEEILRLWRAEGKKRMLPIPMADLASRCWVAANSVEAARIAGHFKFHMLFSHLRTIEQYRQMKRAYVAAGGNGMIAANRPVYVGEDDEKAWAMAEPALRLLWRRFQAEGKIPGGAVEPKDVQELCAHPINFVVGGPESVARQLIQLHQGSPFDVLNVELRWPGIWRQAVVDSLERLMRQVLPLVQSMMCDLPAR